MNTEKIVKKKDSKSGNRKANIKYAAIRIAVSLLMLVIAGGIGAMVAIKEYYGGVDDYAKQYFEYYLNSNWYSMFEDSEFEKTEFISLKEFARIMNAKKPEGKVDTYTIKKLKDKGDKVSYSAKYTIDGQEYVFPFDMVKKDEKIALIYSTWGGNVPSIKLVKDCTLKSMEGTRMTFDGIDIEKYKDESGTYKLGNVFEGEHVLEVTSEGMADITIKHTFNDESNSFEATSDIYKLNAEDEEMMQETALNIVTDFYRYAMSDDDINEMSDRFANEDGRAHALSELSSMKTGVQLADGHELQSISIEDIFMEVAEFVPGKSVTANISYSASYTAKGSTAEYLSTGVVYKGMNSTTAKIYFEYDKGEWLLSDIDIAMIDFTPRVY